MWHFSQLNVSAVRRTLLQRRLPAQGLATAQICLHHDAVSVKKDVQNKLKYFFVNFFIIVNVIVAVTVVWLLMPIVKEKYFTNGFQFYSV